MTLDLGSPQASNMTEARERRPLRPVILLDCDVRDGLCSAIAAALRHEFKGYVIRNAPWGTVEGITSQDTDAIAVRVRDQSATGIRMDTRQMRMSVRATESLVLQVARHNDAQIAAYLATQLREQVGKADHTANDKN